MLIFLTSSNIFDEGAERYLRAFLYNNEQTKGAKSIGDRKRISNDPRWESKLENEITRIKDSKRKK